MNGVSQIGPTDAVFIELEMTTDEIANPRSQGFVYQILQFKALCR
jgi:hypothetical protein